MNRVVSFGFMPGYVAVVAVVAVVVVTSTTTYLVRRFVFILLVAPIVADGRGGSC